MISEDGHLPQGRTNTKYFFIEHDICSKSNKVLIERAYVGSTNLHAHSRDGRIYRANTSTS